MPGTCVARGHSAIPMSMAEQRDRYPEGSGDLAPSAEIAKEGENEETAEKQRPSLAEAFCRGGRKPEPLPAISHGAGATLARATRVSASGDSSRTGSGPPPSHHWARDNRTSTRGGPGRSPSHTLRL